MIIFFLFSFYFFEIRCTGKKRDFVFLEGINGLQFCVIFLYIYIYILKLGLSITNTRTSYLYGMVLEITPYKNWKLFFNMYFHILDQLIHNGVYSFLWVLLDIRYTSIFPFLQNLDPLISSQHQESGHWIGAW